ncbi:aminotransferase class V-fold PLP-dependent enzyme [Paractinoplanes rishiriensis]|uniref:Aminotransferase class V n=1 Tax=Paractinoplanes rishiriensis TaxID=1050105 RepID=A0A919K8U4_9ACTN|nr:aminotransferase class V-fold PLP-dependent enzyme [Actinoplanes rishiriensis]GIF02149.1 aminotransferase class V [Actinoplanes rishiriensis]
MDITNAQALWSPEPGWLNTATYGLPPRPAWDQLQEALAGWRAGTGQREDWEARKTDAREMFARLVRVPVADVATGTAVSQILGPVATAVPDDALVVVPDIEFTSNLFPWLVHEDRLRVTTVPAGQLVDRVSAGCDLVAFSLVQSATGEVADYERLVAAARAVGARVVVDATQACGWLPFDASLADAVVVGGYKWLMAPRGSAFGYLSPGLRETMRPAMAGWAAGKVVDESYYGPPLRLADNARRFDISDAWFSWVGAAPALEVIERIGLDAIRDHDVALANRFLAGLGRPPSNSAIATVDVPAAKEKLNRAGVRASVRNGNVRVAFHIYTTEADVDLALEALTS